MVFAQKELDCFQQPDFGLASTGAHPWVARFPGHVEGSAVSKNATYPNPTEARVRQSASSAFHVSVTADRPISHARQLDLPLPK